MTGPLNVRDVPERWEVVGRVERFSGHVIKVRTDEVRMPNGHETEIVRRDVVSHPGSVAVLALDEADRVLDVYASVAGVRRLLAPQGGVLGALGVLLYQPALTGVTVSLSPATGGARVRVHSALESLVFSASKPNRVPGIA